MRGIPGRALPDLAECLEANLAAARLTSPDVRAVGICLNTSDMEPEAARRLCASTADRLGLPCTDPVAFGVDPIIDHSMSRTLHAQHDRFPLIRPFRIARGTKTAADVVTVTISEGDAIGRGEAVPYPRYGETIDGTLAAIEQVRPLIEQGGGRSELPGRACPPGRRATRSIAPCGIWRPGCSCRDVAAMIGGPALHATGQRDDRGDRHAGRDGAGRGHAGAMRRC